MSRAAFTCALGTRLPARVTALATEAAAPGQQQEQQQQEEQQQQQQHQHQHQRQHHQQQEQQLYPPHRLEQHAGAGGGDWGGGGELRVFVGTSAGQILEYGVRAGAVAALGGGGGGSAPVGGRGVARLRGRATVGGGGKPVDALLFLRGADALLSLCDGAVTIHPAQGEGAGSDFRAMRGAGLLFADASERGSTLGGRSAARCGAALRKNKLCFFALGAPGSQKRGANGRAQALLAEVTLPEAPTSVAWNGDAAVVGTHAGRYLCVNGLRGGGGGASGSPCVSELFQLPPDAPPALALPLPSREGVVLLVEKAGLIADMRGSPAATSLLFPDPPAALCRAGGYVLAAHAGRIDVYRPGTEAAVQSLPLDVHAADGAESLAPHAQAQEQLLAGDSGGGGVVSDVHGSLAACAFGSQLWVLAPVPVLEQARALLEAGRAAEAVALVEADYDDDAEGAGDSTVSVATADMRAAAAFTLFRQLRFAEAREMLVACVGTLHPAEVFGFFPRIGGGRYLVHAPPNVTSSWLKVCAGDAAQIIREGMEAGLPRRARPPVGNSASASAKGEEPTEEVLLAEAVECVATFLVEARKAVPRPRARVHQADGAGLAEAVDSTLLLLLCSEEASRSSGVVDLIESLVGEDGFCADMTVARAALEGAGRQHALALLLRRKGDTSGALQTWAGLGKGEILEGVSASGAVARGAFESAPDGAPDATARRLSARRVGARYAMATLRQSTTSAIDARAALAHVMWAAIVDPAAAVSALASPPPSVLATLPPADVLAAVTESLPERADDGHASGGHGPLACACPRDDFAWRFLQHVVSDTEEGAQSASYHTELALAAARAALATCPAATPPPAARIASEPMLDDAASGRSGSAHVTPSVASPEQTPAGVALLSHVANSKHLSVPQVLRAVRGTPLLRTQVVLHRRMGDHMPALCILAITLRDAEAAERYCQQAGGDSAYLMLLRLYLDPSSAEVPGAEDLQPDYDAAADLLASRGATLDPRDVLGALPPTMPLEAALAPLQRMLEDRGRRWRQAQIARSLARADNLGAAYERLEQLERRVTVEEDKVCAACGARLGTKLLAVYPNGSVACYRCLRQYGEHVDPVTGTDFRVAGAGATAALPGVARTHGR